MDSLSSQNFSNQTNRLLLGQYADPQFGNLTSKILTQIRPGSVTTSMPATAVFDSVVLQMRYDFYVYGSPGETNLELTVHEVTEEINNENVFYTNTQVAYKPDVLGSAIAPVNASYFKEELEDNTTDSVLTAKVRLNDGYGSRLFSSIDPEDENFTNFNLFKSIFKGLAIVPQQADKMVGFNPSDVNTALKLYYHIDTIVHTFSFSLSGGVNYSNITADRAGTELDQLNQFFTEFEPASNRYVQSGGSIVTKLDFTKFYEYIDTIPNLLLNSAELTIESDGNENFAPHNAFALTMLRDNNRYHVLKSHQDTLDYITFGGMVVLGGVLNSDLTYALCAATDQSDLLKLETSTSNKSYRSYPTRFFQKLIELRDKPYKYWAITPSAPPPGKAVTRTVFPKENLKLRLYYTKPISNQTE